MAKCTLLLLVLAFLVSGCNYKVSLVKNEKSAGVDSVLFYQQASISDPFLDKIQNNPGNNATLRTTIYPPPSQRISTQQTNGFRIQVFAGADSMAALTAMQMISGQVTDSVYFVSQGGLFKVQIGDYLSRETADLKKLEAISMGHTGAWVVSTLINIPIDSGLILRPDSNQQKANEAELIRFKIQVLATGDMNKVNQVISELKTKFQYPVYYEQSGNLYKIFVGKFSARPEAEASLQRVRLSGYPDAWLVY